MIHNGLILLTGGIGAGKSVVSRVLRLKGYEVYDTDAAAMRIMNTNSELKERLINRWGEEAYCAGKLNRQFVAAKIFADAEERQWLNREVHSRVIDEMWREWEKHGSPMMVECALPVTSGLYQYMDQIWLVEAEEAERVRRACRRDSSDEAAVKARIKAQSTEFESLPANRTYIISNNGEALLPQIDYLLSQLT